MFRAERHVITFHVIELHRGRNNCGSMAWGDIRCCNKSLVNTNTDNQLNFAQLRFGIYRACIIEITKSRDSTWKFNFRDNMTEGGILSIREVNAQQIELFEWLFGNVIEHCPEAAHSVALGRPYSSYGDLKKAFCNYLDGLDTNGRERVLLCHPDLAGKLCDEKKLTQESQNEQNSAGIDAMTREERLTLNNLNQTYKETFGFPFVICARENRVQMILTAIEHRLKNSREVELKTGIEEVKKICSLRINDLVWSDA